MSKEKQKLILIGNGMAGVRFLEKLCQKNSCPYDITVFGSEPHGGYNRILLSPLLSGEQTLDNVITHPIDWYEDKQINFQKGKTIVSIDRAKKRVSDIDGNQYVYDKLVIATGSNSFVPPIPGRELKGIHTYRTIEDVKTMLTFCNTESKAVVIGGGLLGLEAAYGLKTRGVDVTVLHICPVLMENQLDATASEKLITALESKGITIRTGTVTEHFNGSQHVESVQLNDGTIIPADLVVIAVGIRPNIGLAQSIGLDCERGVLVNDQLQTSDPDIFALGECVQHKNMTYGLVAPLYEQAKICAEYLSGNEAAKYTGSIMATGLKVTGVHLFSSGQILEDDSCKVIRLSDEKKGIYRKLVIKNNSLIGALLYGDITGSLWYQQLIQEKEDITPFKDFIMFGPDYLPEDNSIDSTAIAA
jgi:nitrite reductase [NAD(P)H] large subunit